MREELLIVDGYNMIGAWPELIALKQVQLEQARDRLLQLLAIHQETQGLPIVVVFDAQFVPGARQKIGKAPLRVVYTAQDETADSCIEQMVQRCQERFVQVIVATSDLQEQWHIFGNGAVRKSAFELYRDMQRSQKERSVAVVDYNQRTQQRIRALSAVQQQLLEELRHRLD